MYVAINKEGRAVYEGNELNKAIEAIKNTDGYIIEKLS